MSRVFHRGSLLTLLSLALAGMTGCRSIGRDTIPHDRYDYSGSISESWKNQMLLNIVKLRYLDPPIAIHQPIPVESRFDSQRLQLQLEWLQELQHLFEFALQLPVLHPPTVLIEDTDHYVIAMQVNSRE